MRQLKWSLRRDSLSKIVRSQSGVHGDCDGDGKEDGSGVGAVGKWIERRSNVLAGESERVRLALCPGVKKFVRFYEHLAHPSS